MTLATRCFAFLATIPVCALFVAAPAHAQAWDYGNGGRSGYDGGWRPHGYGEEGRWDGFQPRVPYEPVYEPSYGSYPTYRAWRRPAYGPVAVVAAPPPVVPVVVEQPPVIYEAPAPEPVAYEAPVPALIVHHHVHHVAVRHCTCACTPIR